MTVDVSRNKLADVDGVVEFWQQMPKLRVIYYQGNPGSRQIKHFRHRMVTSLPELTYLDDRPIAAVDRVAAVAWAEGGIAAEREARREFVFKQQRPQEDDHEERKAIISARRDRALERIAREEAARREKQMGFSKPEAEDTTGSTDDFCRRYAAGWKAQVASKGIDEVRREVASGQFSVPMAGAPSDDPGYTEGPRHWESPLSLEGSDAFKKMAQEMFDNLDLAEKPTRDELESITENDPKNETDAPEREEPARQSTQEEPAQEAPRCVEVSAQEGHELDLMD